MTGNVPVAVAGVLVAGGGGTLAAVGGTITAFGATISALSGSGRTAVSELTGIVLTSKIPEGLGKDVAQEAISQAIERNIPDIRSCK